MTSRDRWTAVEGEVVRLYFRNYVGNVLTDVAGTVSVQIRPRGSTTILATPPVVRESTGVYYVEWSIPTSKLGSLKYDPNFPGPGDYQDVWYENGSTVLVAQDFYVASADRQSTLATIRDPLVFSYSLQPTRLEYGARDYVTLNLTEQNNRIADEWPEGEWRLWRGDSVVLNYAPLLHRAGENSYRLYLDTTQFQSGIYKLQFRYEIPEATVNTPAEIVFTRNLSTGWSPQGVGVLRLNVDGLIRAIEFPSSATPPKVESTPPSSLNFVDAANDVLYVNNDGTDRTIRLPRTDASSLRTVQELADELNNGTVPAWYASIGITSFPIVTSYRDLTSVPAGIDGTTLKLNIDGNEYTVIFSSVTTIGDISNQINNQVGSTIATIQSGILILYGQAGGYDSIEVVGGTAAPLLGFVEGQKDIGSQHRLDTIGVTVTKDPANDKLVFTGQPNGALKFYSAQQGSTANVTLGIDGNGITINGSPDLPASIQSSSIVAPFAVETPKDATAIGSITLPTYYALNDGTNNWRTDLHGTSFVFNATTVTFTDRTNNAAIVSPKPTSLFNFPSNTILYLNDGVNATVGVNFTAGNYTPADVVNTINAAVGSTNLVADLYNGLVRISNTQNTGPSDRVIILSNSDPNSAYQILGFGDVLTSTNKPYQNDQTYLDPSDDLAARPYVYDWTPSDVIDHINSTISGATASLDNGKVKITSTSSFTLTAGSPDALAKLYLSSGTYNPVSGQNYELDITVQIGATVYTEQIILSEDSIKTVDDVVVDINSKSTLVTASNVNDYILIETTYKGSTVALTLGDNGSGLLSSLNIAAAWPVTGQDAAPPTYTTSDLSATTINFFAGDNAYLIITYNSDATTVSETLNLSTATSPSAVVTAINSSALASYLTASYISGVLTIEGLQPGSDKQIIIGGLNQGSTANASLGFAIEGVTANGTDGTPYTLETIISKINSAYGGSEVASRSGNNLRLRSIDNGAGARIEVLTGTTADVIQGWGIDTFSAYGETETRPAQTIVSPKINFIIGE